MSFATRLLVRFQKSYGLYSATFRRIFGLIFRCVIDFYNEEKDPGIGMLFMFKFLSDPCPTSSKQKRSLLSFYKVNIKDLVDTLLPSVRLPLCIRFFKESFDSVNPHFITILYSQRPPRKSNVVDQGGWLGLPVINVSLSECISKAPFSHLSLLALGLVVTYSQKPLL